MPQPSDEETHFPWLQTLRSDINRLSLSLNRNEYGKLLKTLESFISTETPKLISKPKRATKFYHIVCSLISNFKLIEYTGDFETSDGELTALHGLILTHFLELVERTTLKDKRPASEIADNVYSFMKMVLQMSAEYILDTVLTSTSSEDYPEARPITLQITKRIVHEKDIYNQDSDTFFKYLAVLKQVQQCNHEVKKIRKILLNTAYPSEFPEYLKSRLKIKLNDDLDLNFVLTKIQMSQVLKDCKARLLREPEEQLKSKEGSDPNLLMEAENLFFIDTTPTGESLIQFDNLQSEANDLVAVEDNSVYQTDDIEEVEVDVSQDTDSEEEMDEHVEQHVSSGYPSSPSGEGEKTGDILEHNPEEPKISEDPEQCTSVESADGEEDEDFACSPSLPPPETPDSGEESHALEMDAKQCQRTVKTSIRQNSQEQEQTSPKLTTTTEMYKINDNQSGNFCLTYNSTTSSENQKDETASNHSTETIERQPNSLVVNVGDNSDQELDDFDKDFEAGEGGIVSDEEGSIDSTDTIPITMKKPIENISNINGDGIISSGLNVIPEHNDSQSPRKRDNMPSMKGSNKILPREPIALRTRAKRKLPDNMEDELPNTPSKSQVTKMAKGSAEPDISPKRNLTQNGGRKSLSTSPASAIKARQTLVKQIQKSPMKSRLPRRTTTSNLVQTVAAVGEVEAPPNNKTDSWKCVIF